MWTGHATTLCTTLQRPTLQRPTDSPQTSPKRGKLRLLSFRYKKLMSPKHFKRFSGIGWAASLSKCSYLYLVVFAVFPLSSRWADQKLAAGRGKKNEQTKVVNMLWLDCLYKDGSQHWSGQLKALESVGTVRQNMFSTAGFCPFHFWESASHRNTRTRGESEAAHVMTSLYFSGWDYAKLDPVAELEGALI